MPRKRRDEETILAFWKQFARDKNCPWSIRIYCTFALAVATKMVPATMAPPGVSRYKVEPVSVAEPAPPPPLQETNVPDVNDFLKQLRGGNDGGS